MSEHTATVAWKRTTPDFAYPSYVRDHDVTLGPAHTTLRASAAPEYRGDAALPNPEDLLVAALSSCHMLTFLAIAARKGYVVDAYDDDAVGHLEKGADGRVAVTRVVLRPRIAYGGDKRPSDVAELALHELAHRGCFIASSVKTEVRVEPR
jgi:organic hydroperoxide reductase OsmC/OhrA